MATHHFYFFLILLISTLSTISTTTALSSTPHTQIKPTKPSDNQHLHKIIHALTGAGDFRNWAVVLSTTDPSAFPITATLFIPSDNALSNLTSAQFLQFDPSSFAYHITPQLIPFSLLKTLKMGSRIPTLLPKHTILVTNNSVSNYTIDESQITHPDLYINGEIAVHGIGSLLNYSVFGGGFLEENEISEPVLPHQTPISPMGLHRSTGSSIKKNYLVIFILMMISLWHFDQSTRFEDQDSEWTESSSCLSVKNCILIFLLIMEIVFFMHVKILSAWKVVLLVLPPSAIYCN